MTEPISQVAALQRYFNEPSKISGPVAKVSVVEMKAFLASITDAQRLAYATAAAAELGATLKPKE